MSVVTLEEFIEEVWLYLLGVLSVDKSQEMTSVRSKFLEYESADKRVPYLEKQIRAQVLRYYRQRLTGGITSSHRGMFTRDLQGRQLTSAPRKKSTSAVPEEHRLLPSTQFGLQHMKTGAPVHDSEMLNEQRRFAQIIEKVICAYINRHSQDGATAAQDGAAGPDAQRVALQASVESHMPRAYQWAPQATVLSGSNVFDFHPSLVYLCAPFAHCMKAEAGVYFAFERLMHMIQEYNMVNPLPQRVASFLTLFRTTLPELHAYFEAEEVDLVAVATSWLQHLLARELQIEDVMRLWDTYFAVPDLLDLHVYVCLAILTNCKDALEEFDRSETTSMLFSLPPLDIDRIISDAVNIRLSHEHDQMFE
ncbi:hypothetical protein MCUN1_002066 [Malassezia cuniculi]|uniref:Rab-GAP TBC domain-containing protein n=1 Tax=Malassezia cuniculi TaxID=948313 RepID=A0AAF0EVS2_9BASI|nr:hypothetical protein MCUN1_002066 [Malassezia cuniculi]